MLNTFPDLLTYSMLAPFILRVIIGLIFVDLGILKFKSERKRWRDMFNVFHIRPANLFVSLYGLIQIVGGALLIIGLWTQVAALIAFIVSMLAYYLKGRYPNFIENYKFFFFLLALIAVSLLFLGAGFLAFDLPL